MKSQFLLVTHLEFLDDPKDPARRFVSLLGTGPATCAALWTKAWRRFNLCMRCRSLNDILALYHPLPLKPGKHDKIKPKRDLQLFWLFLVVFDACYTKVTAEALFSIRWFSTAGGCSLQLQGGQAETAQGIGRSSCHHDHSTWAAWAHVAV